MLPGYVKEVLTRERTQANVRMRLDERLRADVPRSPGFSESAAFRSKINTASVQSCSSRNICEPNSSSVEFHGGKIRKAQLVRVHPTT